MSKTPQASLLNAVSTPTVSGPQMQRARRHPEWLAAMDHAIANWAETNGRITSLAYEFVRFGVKQAWACLFAGAMLALILGTHLWYPKHAALTRYDFIALAALTIQGLMLWTKLESWEEARIIAVFHVVGTIMEIFKTSMGSWVYPEPSLLRLAGVPVFTGFMYACVGSFMVRCWALFEFRFDRHPPLWALSLLSLAIYVNFFTHHVTLDIRYLLFAASAGLLAPATIHYKVWKRHRQMPLLVAALLAAWFIWLAENIGTSGAAWLYPNQRNGWQMVSPSKYGSWYLLMIISYTLVFSLHRPKRNS
jgi:uncharacterized membrane protein YoaT (DUF817 family)